MSTLIAALLLQTTGCALIDTITGKSKEVTKIEKSEQDDSKLLLTYSDGTTQLIEDTISNNNNENTEPVTCACEQKYDIVQGYQLTDTTQDRCKINIQICKDCGKAHVTYITHSEWKDYRVEPTLTSTGESGKKCKDCGFKRDVQILEQLTHRHYIVDITDEELESYVIKQYGKLPNPCTEEWYTEGQACECGLWFATVNKPTGHTLSLDINYNKAHNYNERISVSTKCLSCNDDIILLEETKLPIMSDADFIVESNCNDTLCNVKCYLRAKTFTLEGNDKFEDGSNSYTMPDKALVYNYEGTHIHETGRVLFMHE